MLSGQLDEFACACSHLCEHPDQAKRHFQVHPLGSHSFITEPLAGVVFHSN